MKTILTLNAGSSSLKIALFEIASGAPVEVARGGLDDLNGRPRLKLRFGDGAPVDKRVELDASSGLSPAVAALLAALSDRLGPIAPIAVGHRVVHGGPDFGEPVICDAPTIDALERLRPLAPLHQPHNIAGIRAAIAAFPSARQIACFDTAFHRNQPFVNDTFALPRSFYAEGVRRYGFHGLSYEYVTGELARLAPHHAAGRLIVAHLGNGASMCAISAGRSVASTMGFSALDGLPMGTRCGQLDPGVLLYLMGERGLSAGEIEDLLYRRSGLLGLSGVSSDMRTLQASTEPAAQQAIDYFVFRVRRELGAMIAVLSGLDAITFCGGIGENAVMIRDRILAGFEWIGIEIDDARNRAGALVISSERSRVKVFVVPTNEEAMIARHTLRLVGRHALVDR